MPRRAALPSLLALLLAAPLAAQPPGSAPPGAAARPRSDSVPRELVQALLPNSDGLRVGEPAGDLPRELLPTNGIVLGSVEYGGTSTTLVVLMQPEHDAVAAFEERATAAGWTAPPAPAVSPFDDGRHTRGFVASDRSSRMTVALGPMGMGGTRTTAVRPLCRGDAMVNASTAPWSGGRTLLRVMTMRAGEYSPCRPREEVMAEARLMRSVTVYDSIVPALQPPPRAHVQWAGGGSSNGEWETRAVVETTLTSAELLAHYAAEMAREGWTPLGEGAATPSVALQAWRKADAKGVLWHATLVFSARPEPGRQRAELRMERAGSR
jgi:hypothetical protein